MIKGPKAILSSAIANALAEYFIVNPSQIESNLLSDANITLHNVQLKSTVMTLTTINTHGGSKTVLITSGCVDKVTFSWKWSVSRDVSATAEWIKNAVLVIEGAKFVCRLEHRDAAADNNEDDTTGDTAEKNEGSSTHKSSFVNPSTIDDKTAKEIKVTPGGISGFVQRQIEHVIDNLTLRMVDFELKIEAVMMMDSSSSSSLPSSSVVKSDGDIVATCVGGTTTTSRSFIIAIDQVELLSYGRQKQQQSSSSSSSSSLKQRVNLRSFRSSISIINTGSSVTKRDEDTTAANQDNNNIDVNNFINEFAFLPTGKHSSNNNNNDNEQGEVCNVDSDREGSSSSTIEEKVYHLIEPFSYSADVTRVGSKRFSGLMTGLDVVGIVPSSKEEEDGSGSDSGDGGGGIALHMGKVQVESLMLLGEMMLTPPSTPGEIGESVATTDNSTDSTAADNEAGTDITEATQEEAIATTATIDENDPSTFTVPLSFATLIVDEKKFSVSGIYTKYKADGTTCQFDARKVSYESSDGGLAEASQIHVSMRPTVKMIVNSIDTFYIPDVMQLTKPIEFIELKYEGKALTARFQDIEVITFGKGQQDTASSTITTTKESSPAKSSSTKTQPSSKMSILASSKAGRQKQEQAVMITAPKLPFSLDVSVKTCDIKKSADGSSMQMSNLQLFCNENDTGNSSDVALRFDHFKNHLASISDVNMCASLPYDAVNCINALNLSIGDATIVSGHSVEDWQTSFQPKYQSKTAKSSTKNAAPSAVIKLPNATIADIKLTITYAANVGVKVKQTKFIAKAFKGKEATTSKDIISYYTLACLAKAPEFISNAEVLGLNVLDSTMGTWGNFLGVATPFGAVTGVEAVVGVDAVKNAVNAGKRGRGVSENDDYQESDIARGLFQAAKEATVRGAEMRGKKDDEGNVIDWAVGATTTTGEYVGENKTRLGGAA